MPPYSIFMFLFSAAILLYAAVLAITKDYGLLPRRASVSVNPKDKKAYTFQISKAVALTAAAPASFGILSVWSVGAGFAAFIIVLILALWGGTRIMKDML